ncbi:Uncharacterised protein [Rothia aeria]|uniref:Uncharacterized protein n=1 Tax=Rothia aeria TaxID=172042 RepID=A0A7Z9A484_9MICC|nr:Uncharacterised protein [Rothia aeria]
MIFSFPISGERKIINHSSWFTIIDTGATTIVGHGNLIFLSIYNSVVAYLFSIALICNFLSTYWRSLRGSSSSTITLLVFSLP